MIALFASSRKAQQSRGGTTRLVRIDDIIERNGLYATARYG
jgi:hypothetical protein